MGVISLIKADFNRYVATGGAKGIKILLNPGFLAVAIFRINRKIYFTFRKVPIIGYLYAIISFIILKLNQIILGISFPESFVLGKGLYISHLGTIIVNGNCSMGENCNLAPMVVIGWGRVNGKEGYPQIGNRVWIGPGAKIFGPIIIEDDVAIGANAVVNFDVPKNSTVVGSSARIIPNKGSSEYISF